MSYDPTFPVWMPPPRDRVAFFATNPSGHGGALKRLRSCRCPRTNTHLHETYLLRKALEEVGSSLTTERWLEIEKLHNLNRDAVTGEEWEAIGAVFGEHPKVLADWIGVTGIYGDQLTPGLNVRAERLSRGWSQPELGARMDPPRSGQWVSKRELGARPSPDALRSLAAALEVSVSKLIPASEAAAYHLMLSPSTANMLQSRNRLNELRARFRADFPDEDWMKTTLRDLETLY